MVHQGTPWSALRAAGAASQVALQHRRPRPIRKEPEGFDGGAEQGNDRRADRGRHMHDPGVSRNRNRRARQHRTRFLESQFARARSRGAVASRGLKSIDLTRNNVAVIRYDTAFARKAAAVETVTLAFENGGWLVSDYSVN